MSDSEKFVDYYDLLQVDPGCDTRILEVAYHHFAKQYHPDHVETADTDMFNRITTAYRLLADPAKRADYDKIYVLHRGTKGTRAFTVGEIDDDEAIGDAEIHQKILHALYKRRRESAAEPGLAGWLIQELLECTDDQFEFHIWYLRSKGFIEKTEQGLIAITVDGVDHTIATSRTSKVEKLLIAQSTPHQDVE